MWVPKTDFAITDILFPLFSFPPDDEDAKKWISEIEGAA